MAIYIDWDNKSIKGNVTAAGFEDCFEVDNFNFGCGRSISMEPGAVANREAGVVSVSEISFSKPLDAASSGIFQASLSADAGVTVKIYIVQTGANSVEKYAEYELSDVLPSSYSINASAGGRPHENVSLSFSQIIGDLTAADKTHKNTKNVKVCYDLTTTKVS